MSDAPVPRPAWSGTAPSYSSNVGAASATAATALTALANSLLPITESSSVLDVGAGTGAITQAIASQSPSTRILATDISGDMLQEIDKQQLSNVRTKVIDAMQLSEELEGKQGDEFSHVFSTFMLQTLTTPLDAVKQMLDVLEPGGVIGLALWGERVEVYDIWTKAVRKLEPEYVMPPPFDDESAWRTKEELAASLAAAGFKNVRTEMVRMPFGTKGVEEYIQFWFGTRNPGATKVRDRWVNGGGEVENVKGEMEKVLHEEYEDGNAIYLWGVLGVGRK